MRKMKKTEEEKINVERWKPALGAGARSGPRTGKARVRPAVHEPADSE